LDFLAVDNFDFTSNILKLQMRHFMVIFKHCEV